jgi:hypothetical protein
MLTPLTSLPSPVEVGLPVSLVDERPASNSEKAALLFLKAVVFILARLLPMTLIAVLLLLSPVRAALKEVRGIQVSPNPGLAGIN